VGSDAREVESERARGIANAGLVLAVLLWGLAWYRAWPERPAEISSCPHPVEIAQQDGRTRVVSCADRPDPLRPLHGPAVLLFGRPIDLNRADARTLESLPGIGPGRARAILEARAERPFTHLEDLERVSGIGPRIVAGLQGWAATSAVAENAN
jgi:hypothetical protein